MMSRWSALLCWVLSQTVTGDLNTQVSRNLRQGNLSAGNQSQSSSRDQSKGLRVANQTSSANGSLEIAEAAFPILEAHPLLPPNVSIHMEAGTSPSNFTPVAAFKSASGWVGCWYYGCRGSYHPEFYCQCNSGCTRYRNCCWDYGKRCGWQRPPPDSRRRRSRRRRAPPPPPPPQWQPSPPPSNNGNGRGLVTAFHQTSPKACKLIVASAFRPGSDGHCGGAIYKKNLAKRASKIAMLFSGLNRTVPLQAHEYKVEPDIKGGVVRSYNFTDGCGFMSPNFASELQQIFELNYKPSAVHIRYRGIEGVLCLKDDLTEVKVQFHKSMQKFFTPDENMPRMFNFVDVVDYSRPYVNGYLNSQMVMLLVERGVSAQNLEDLQDGFHELVEGMCNKTAEYFLSFKGEFRLLQEIQENGIDSGVRNRLKLLQKQELDDMGMAAYTRVLVPKSRVVFAVCDPLHKLKYGECYFSPTTPGEEARNFPIGQKLLVTRSPCYVPGDLRVLKLTNDREGYENLKDCLVLPARGPRPHAFECSGGDLSGKKFFVCWDKKIIPSGNQKPCDYSPTKGAKLRRTSSKSLSKVTEKFKRNDHGKEVKHREEMLQYFATYTDETQQKIEREYMKYATSNGPSSKECRRLSKMLHQATNFTKDANDFEKQLEEAEQPISSELPSYSLSNRLSCVFSTDAEQSVNEIMRMIDNKAKVFFERMQFETKKSEA